MRLMILAIGLFFGSMAMAQAKITNYIFFIHGIGGNENTFGSMPEAIAYHMNMENLSERHMSYRFVYDTEDPALDTDDFAIQLGEFIHTKVKDRIQPQDKISLVSHSQGGLVSTIWYFHAYMQMLSQKNVTALIPAGGLLENYHPEYANHMDAILTIGTPFWGSKLATLLISDTKMGNVARTLGKDFVEKTGRRQLEEMALGSRTIINFRKNVSGIPHAILNQMRQNVRPANIAGAARLDEIFSEKSYGASAALTHLKKYAFGGRHFESDIAVSVPSAHFDSYYSIDNSLGRPEGYTTQISQTYKTDFAPLTILNTIHASPWAEEVYDMAYVPSKCLDDKNCDHPTYKYVLNHLLGRPLPKFGNGVSSDELAGFTASVRVNLPEDLYAKEVKVQIEKVPLAGEQQVGIVMANTAEMISTFDFFHPTRKNVLFRTFTGHLKYIEDISFASYSARQNGVPLKLKISAPGFKTRYVETKIQPTYSTFVEVSLEKR